MRLDKQKVVHARLMGFCERMLPKLRRGEQATEEELREAASLQMLWDQTCGVAAVAAQTPQPATGSAPSNASSGSPSSFYTTPPPPPSFSSASSPTSLSPPHWFSPSSVSCSPPSHVVLPHGTVAPSVLSRGVSGFLASSSSTLPQPAAGAAGRHRSDAHGEETVLFASCRTASYRTAAGSFSPSSFASLPQEEALFESISERSSGPRAQRAGVGEAPTHTSLFLPFFSSFSLSPSSWRTRGGPRPTCSTTLATEEGLGSVAPSEAGGLARSFTSLSSFGGSEGGNICAALSAGTVGSRPRARRDPEAAAATGRPWWSVVRRALGTARPARVPSRPRLTREAVWLSRRYDQDEGEEADASFVPFSSSEEEANDLAGGGRKGERSLKKRASGGESERRSETDTAETPSPQRLAREPRAGSEIEDEAVASRPRLAGRNSLQGRRTEAPAPDGRKEDAKEIGSEKERSGAGKRGGAEAPRTATASRGGPQRNGEAREGREGEETEGRETRRDATDEETAVLHEGRRRRNPSRAARPRGFRNVVELEDPEDFAAACAARLAERRREAQATRKAATAASGSSDPCADASAISSRDPCALPPAACAQGSASVSGLVSLLASFGSPSTCLTLSAQVQGVASSREASPGEAVVPARVESRSRVRRRAKGPAAERQLPVERAEYQGTQRGNAKEQGAERSRGSGATAADPTGETKARGERATASGLSREGELSRRGGEDAARREASAAHAVKEDEDAADKSQAETGRRGVQGDSRARNARGRRFLPCTRFQGGARGPLQRPPSAEELSQLPPLCAPAAPLDGDGEGEESSGDAERGADDCSRAQAEGARQQEEKTEASTEKRRARRTDTAAPRVPRRSPRLQTNPARTAPEEATREQDDHKMFPAAPKACNDRYLKAAPPLAHGPTTSPSQVSTEAEERDAEAHNEKPLNRVTRRS
ncbi:hypothetical protein BESB_005900 [Besnoitia besnoiti]|uniref:Uncharacterized protein n=1 Tax=Besnoitia besnoiti TaxID=94643 RepID=A0A2A9MK03_BESBE|nr:hypothetical protein BESB_005900 [Besnoitia besnoiti]PFH38249.1 hypothetical protein BESB_005900 [Besnoitia besnoiti]